MRSHNDQSESEYLNALEFIENLPAGARACRGGRNHDFLGGEQVRGEEVAKGIVHTETACARGCGVIKVEEYDIYRAYYTKDPHYRYPDGYLIKEQETGSINRADLAAA